MKLTPADEGIMAAKQDANKLKKIDQLVDDFKLFVADAIAEGHMDEDESALSFLEKCFEVYTDSL